MPTIGYILADSGIFRILAPLNIFIFSKAYLEPMAYSGIFRTIYCTYLVSFRYVVKVLLKSNFCIIWTLFRQIQAYLEVWLALASNISSIFRHIHKVTLLVTLVEEYLPIFAHISADYRSKKCCQVTSLQVKFFF